MSDKEYKIVNPNSLETKNILRQLEAFKSANKISTPEVLPYDDFAKANDEFQSNFCNLLDFLMASYTKEMTRKVLELYKLKYTLSDQEEAFCKLHFENRIPNYKQIDAVVEVFREAANFLFTDAKVM